MRLAAHPNLHYTHSQRVMQGTPRKTAGSTPCGQRSQGATGALAGLVGLAGLVAAGALAVPAALAALAAEMAGATTALTPGLMALALTRLTMSVVLRMPA